MGSVILADSILHGLVFLHGWFCQPKAEPKRFFHLTVSIADQLCYILVRLVEEIILNVCCCKVILSSGLASERFTVADLLKVVQTAGDTLVAVAVEGVQVDTGSAVHTGVHFGTFKDRLSVSTMPGAVALLALIK